MYNQPRQATVTCTSANATLWGLQRSKFQGIQQLTAMDVQAKMVSALEAVPLLKASLDSEQLHRLADSFEEVSYQADERIIVQGDVGDSFYVILEGQVQCISESSGQVVMELGRGDYFGERALLKDDPRAVHVDAACATQCARLTRQVFTQALGPLQSLMENELTRRILRAVPLLSHLTEAERDGVITQFKEVKYAPTEFIIRQVAP